MTPIDSLKRCLATGSIGLILLCGCGQGDSAEPSNLAASQPPADVLLGNPSATTQSLPTASIRQTPAQGGDGASSAAPTKGSAAWYVQEAKSLRRQPQLKTASAEDPDSARQMRNQEIIDASTIAIGKSHSDPAQEATFSEAVRLLMDARLEQALEGDQHEIDVLFEDAASLYKRAPKSAAAAEAAYAVARFTHINARRYAKKEPRWVEEFARQARNFGENFPHEDGRAVSLLYSAGWSCELHGMRDQAIECYTTLKENFPQSPQAKQVTAVLRRLNLGGTSVQLAGPTLDGGFVSIDDYRGRVVLIVFWSNGTKRFEQQIPLLTEITAKYEEDGFSIVGVNLDDTEETATDFLQENSWHWPQIFFPDPEKRRWDNPVVKYYGIRDIPTLWLIDQQGIVVDTTVDIDQLDNQVRRLLQRGG